jgi:glutathionylspermidine synthase
MLDHPWRDLQKEIVLLEPPWKLLMSNKAFLVVLYYMFPDNEYLLPTKFALNS